MPALNTELAQNTAMGLGKSGFSSSALSIWAMRRAFRIDPDSLHYLSLDSKVQGAVNALTDRYTDVADGAS